MVLGREYSFVSSSFIHPTRLSAHLFELTNDTKYLSAAAAAANFVSTHMYDGNAIVDTVRLSSSPSAAGPNCTTLPIPQFSYITGFTIWGFAVLGTQNASYTTL